MRSASSLRFSQLVWCNPFRIRKITLADRRRSSSRHFLRSSKILMQNGAILRNALRKRNDELPSVSNAMQRSETLSNSLGLNYKSAALNQLSYAGVSHTKAVFSELIKSSSWPISRTALQRRPRFHGSFLGHEKWLGSPGGAGVVATDGLQRPNW